MNNKEKEFLEIYKTTKLSSENIQLILSVFSIDEIKKFKEEQYHFQKVYKLSFNKKAEDLIHQIEDENKILNDSERMFVLEYLFEKIKRAGKETIDYFMRIDMKRILKAHEKDKTIKGIYSSLLDEDFESTLSDKEKELRKIIANFKTLDQENIKFLTSDLVDLNEFKKIHEEIRRVRYSVHQMKWKIIYDMVEGRIKDENITDEHMNLFFDVCYSGSMSGFKSQKDYLLSLNRDQLFRFTKETNYSEQLSIIIEKIEKEDYKNKLDTNKTYKEKKEFIKKYHSNYLRGKDEKVVEYILNNENIDKCLELFGKAENFHNYKNDYYEKKWKDFINKKEHTKEEKIEILLKEFPDSFYRQPDFVQGVLLNFDIREILDFKNSGEVENYYLRSFILKKKFGFNLDKSGNIIKDDGHIIPASSYILYELLDSGKIEK